MERLWPARLRWRLRGAWLWPAFIGLTVVDGVLITLLPPYTGTPPGLVGGLLLAGFANLLLTAVVAPFAGRALRRRRPDLPRPVALDQAGTALLCALTVVLLRRGRRAPARGGRRRRGDEAAMVAAVRALRRGARARVGARARRDRRPRLRAGRLPRLRAREPTRGGRCA